MPRYANNVDANQPEIVAAYRKAGATVQHLHSVGEGCPDLIIGFRGVDFWVEIIGAYKLKQFRKTGGLSVGQVIWHRDWRGSPVHVVKSVDEALAVLGLMPGNVIPIKGTIS